jgi:capsular exopolysaccharide synthesis family protein
MTPKPVSIATAPEARTLAEMRAEQAEESFDLLEYWRTITKRKWSIIGLALAVTLLAALIVFGIRPTYRSGAMLLIEAQKNKVVGIEEVYSGMSANREYYQTQAEILKSRELAAKVVQKLKLATHPEFDPRQQEAPFWKRWLGMAGADAESLGIEFSDEDQATGEDAISKRVTRRVQSQITVEPVRLSQLVRVSFDSYDPELAAKIANMVAETYIESDLEARYQMTQKASNWLSERLGGLRQKVEAAEKALQQYREKERIVDVKGVAQSGASRQLEQLTTALVEARNRRNEAENRYNQIRGIRGGAGSAAPSYESVPAVMNNLTVGQMRTVEAEADKKLAELSNRYGREHPRMVQAEGELRAARESTRRAIENVVASITRDYEVARANEASIERSLGQSKGEIQDINRKEFQLAVLEREVAANKQLFDMFLGRFKETSAAGDLQSTVARVVDAAIPSAVPYKPNKRQVVLIALVVGLFVAVMLALLLERLDSTVKTSHDVESKLGLPVLAALPIITERKVKIERIFELNPQAVFSEGIRTARTGILLSSIDAPHRMLVITSSIPGEGKTTFATNLALAFAQTKRVVLVDADMRRPSIGKLFGKEPNSPGLSSLVAASTPASECIFKVDDAELHVVPSGPIPPNPLELMLSKRFEDALYKLQEMFEMVIIDSPPVQLVSDAMVISRHCSGLIFVVKADDTPYQVARNAVKRLRQAQAHLIGVALNQLDFQRADRYYGEYTGYSKYGYKRYYGAYGGKKKRKAAA